MKAFRFRAASLLELRRRQEDDARAELAKRQSLAAHAAAERDRARAALGAADAAFCTALRDGVDAPGIERHRNWITGLQQSVRTRELACEACQRDVGAALAASQLAHRAVRMLERLHDHAKVRYDAASRAAELKEMDEFAASRARRTLEGG